MPGRGSNISAKIQETARAKDSLSRDRGFPVSHSGGSGGRTRSWLATAVSSRLLQASCQQQQLRRGIPTDRQAVGSLRQGSSDELRTADSAKRSSTACPALTTRLACVFTAGPCTETNIGILLGPLDLHKVPFNAEDSPQVSVRFVSFNFFFLPFVNHTE